MTMKISAKQLVAEANAEIETVSVEAAKKLLGDENTVFIDIRDVRELAREGRIPGAMHMPRGMLEFWVDPDSPYYRDVFGSGKKFIFFCAGALRSALATQQVQRMGLEPVAHLEGGFGAWRDAGGPIEAPEPKPEKK
ncbi:MAG: rhodanese-like domain-containing protein [Proteobacteria bacterium]|jgi:rhodanese-related sulfurtransferase|nr:rhodanese-like domain-containing protein [Pseudomonadota bacterium]